MRLCVFTLYLASRVVMHPMLPRYTHTTFPDTIALTCGFELNCLRHTLTFMCHYMLCHDDARIHIHCYTVHVVCGVAVCVCLTMYVDINVWL